MKIKKKSIIVVLIIVLIMSIFYTLNNISLIDIIKLPKNVYAEFKDFEYFNDNKEFGKFITFDYDETVETTSNDEIKVKIKLFDIFTLKEINVSLDKQELYVPGRAIGFNLTSQGLIIIGSNNISSENGDVDLLNVSPLKIGDELISINGKLLESGSDIESIINLDENKGKPVSVVVLRDDEKLCFEINPILDKNTQTYKLGLWVKNSTNGVGTLTYIEKDNLRFGALGHPITDTSTKEIFDLKSGLIYDCNVIGVTKGYKGKPGELKGLFLEGKNEQGIVDKNGKYGVYGNVKDDSTFIDGDILEAGGRFSTRPGKAKIRTCIDGTTAKDYDIEIIKTNYQSASNNKSMVIKVVDKELLKKTGGIVQGMSGSPIIQNGKVIGAVTHVFVSDPTKGFGIYLDWMLKE